MQKSKGFKPFRNDDEARNAQRIVMLVGVTKRSDPKVNVEAALRKAMKRMADSKQAPAATALTES